MRNNPDEFLKNGTDQQMTAVDSAAGAVGERLHTARRHVSSLREALLSPSPEAIEGCLPGLAEAATCLGQIEAILRDGAAGSALAGDLQALQRDLKMIGRMIEHSSAFYRGWASLLAAAAGGYTRCGRAAEINIAATMAVRG